jgi:hypothetical protein
MIVALWLACSTTRALAPLQKGTAAVTVSLGGPILDFGGTPLPLPIASLGGIYGVDGKTNVHAAFYPPPLGQFAVLGFDVGASRELVVPHAARPRIMADLTAYSFFGDLSAGDPKGGYRLFPDLSAVASWPIPGCDACTAKVSLYAGIDSLFQPFPEFHWAPSPEVGVEIYAGKHVGFQLELKWLEGWRPSDPYVADWYGVGGNGALSFQLGINVFPSRVGHP